MTEVPERLQDFLEENLRDALYRTAGFSHQRELETLPVDNMCDSVSNEFAVLIEDEFEYTVKSPVKAPVNGAKHFVAVVTETPNGELEIPVVVDGTIRQFGDEFPTILIESVDSSVVDELYDEVRL